MVISRFLCVLLEVNYLKIYIFLNNYHLHKNLLSTNPWSMAISKNRFII